MHTGAGDSRSNRGQALKEIRTLAGPNSAIRSRFVASRQVLDFARFVVSGGPCSHHTYVI